MLYKLCLDFDEPIQYFMDPNHLFDELKHTGHVVVYNASDAKYQQMAEACCAPTTGLPFYIETSVSTEGVFVESEELWIENYMLDEFYNPENRPFVEVFLQE